ncbi:polysaccharide deacetylase family protein [Rossellomorea vietnamensis]|uniref:Polysaccharide deacetylase family protein n=1 Tax=Rossellomorea vietnamensis TaxID=218284 RepID=A0A5D4KKV8_9BACI|nr:polysaccharide deacetylase family protein [Rossellomorea vietnamensis]TYR77479.1 polysaccharide deacetylase family protein [Rossellomorea vietnamensis]
MNFKVLTGIAVCIALAILSVSNPMTAQYVKSLKEPAVAVDSKPGDLMVKIKSEAEKYEVSPIDAKNDPVWKGTPGYNGLKVNIQSSYEKMKKEGKFDSERLVFEQVPPETHLSNLPPLPIYRGNPEKPMASFIINVAWGNEYIPDMLAVLKKHQIYATFFLEGRWVKQNPELAKMIAESGHEIGNHSFSHPKMETLTPQKIREEMSKTNEIIEATTGRRVSLFGPPSGGFNDEVVKIADELKMKTILWSVDTIDWQKPSPNVIVERVTSKLHNGALILMHPTASTSSALPSLIMAIKQKELRIGTVSSLLKEERIIKTGNNSLLKGKSNDKN